MKNTKNNKERINDLKSIFQKTTASEKARAKHQIERAKHTDSDFSSNEEQVDVRQPVVTLTSPERAPRKKEVFLVEEESVLEAELKQKKQPNIIVDTKQQQLRFNAVFSAIEQRKMMELRMFLTQRGINTSISDSQLARLAMRKLVITEDLVELFKQVQLEDGRRYRR